MEENSKYYLVIKKGKYMTGHGYATGRGYSFSWSKDINDARKMNESTSNSLAIYSGGKQISFDLPKLTPNERQMLNTIEVAFRNIADANNLHMELSWSRQKIGKIGNSLKNKGYIDVTILKNNFEGNMYTSLYN